jgi:hypothetical protein
MGAAGAAHAGGRADGSGERGIDRRLALRAPKTVGAPEVTETMWATRVADVDAAYAVDGARRALCARRCGMERVGVAQGRECFRGCVQRLGRRRRHVARRAPDYRRHSHSRGWWRGREGAIVGRGTGSVVMAEWLRLHGERR